MRKLHLLALGCLLVWAVFSVGACVPGEPPSPQEPEAAPATPEASAPEVEPAPEPAPEPVPEPAPEPPVEPVAQAPATPTEEVPADTEETGADTGADAPQQQAKDDLGYDPYMPTVDLPPPEEGSGEQGLRLPLTPESQKAAYQIALTPNPEEKGGGADVEGAFHMTGKIRPTNAEHTTWVFKGDLTFPTGGYKFGQISHDDVGLNPEGRPSIIIFMPVSLPPVDAIVSQALDKHTFEYTFEAPKDAAFIVTYSQLWASDDKSDEPEETQEMQEAGETAGPEESEASGKQ